MAILTLIRHGQSNYNAENRFTGMIDAELTLLGQSEARLAASKVKSIVYDCAYTSQLVRAKESLHIILDENQQQNIPVAESEALNERNYGSLEGLNKGESAQKYGVSQVEVWRRSFDVRESLEDTFNRFVPYFKSEIEPKLANGENVLVVAHGNSLRALVMYLENISPVLIAKFDITSAEPRDYCFDDSFKMISVENL